MDLALGVFLLGMATDVLDGHIARTRGPITDFGKLMDPIADKLFVGTAFVEPRRPRDAGGRDRRNHPVPARLPSARLRWVAKGRGVVISADAFGKAKTGLQVLTSRPSSTCRSQRRRAVSSSSRVMTAVTILSGMSYFLTYATAPRLPDETGSSRPPHQADVGATSRRAR